VAQGADIADYDWERLEEKMKKVKRDVFNDRLQQQRTTPSVLSMPVRFQPS
jgi:hypothetical protein